MGMPVSVEIIAHSNSNQTQAIEEVFKYFEYVDETFSTFKETSEISKINQGITKKKDWSEDMKSVFALAEKTKLETDGYFDIVTNDGTYDPSGIVKGWAILNAASLIKKLGFENYYVEAGGDIQVSGKRSSTEPWRIGIKNPFDGSQIIKTVALLRNEGIATSGSYERGNHIYNPKDRHNKLVNIVSVTVIGPDVLEADRLATAAFAMQHKGILFLEKIHVAGYMIDKNKQATMTSHFHKYVQPS